MKNEELEQNFMPLLGGNLDSVEAILWTSLNELDYFFSLSHRKEEQAENIEASNLCLIPLEKLAKVALALGHLSGILSHSEDFYIPHKLDYRAYAHHLIEIESAIRKTH